MCEVVWGVIVMISMVVWIHQHITSRKDQPSFTNLAPGMVPGSIDGFPSEIIKLQRISFFLHWSMIFPWFYPILHSGKTSRLRWDSRPCSSTLPSATGDMPPRRHPPTRTSPSSGIILKRSSTCASSRNLTAGLCVTPYLKEGVKIYEGSVSFSIYIYLFMAMTVTISRSMSTLWHEWRLMVVWPDGKTSLGFCHVLPFWEPTQDPSHDVRHVLFGRGTIIIASSTFRIFQVI